MHSMIPRHAAPTRAAPGATAAAAVSRSASQVSAVVAGLAVATAVWLANLSPYLPAPEPDAASFLGAAISLVERGELRVPVGHWTGEPAALPLAHYPPGFSLALAAFGALGVPWAVAMALVLALSAGVTASLVFALVARVAGGRVAALAVVALAITPPLVQLHTAMWSEPLYFALLAATYATMARDPARPLRYGSLAALAAMVRYVGVGLVAAAATWAFLHARGGRRRVRCALAAGLPGVVLLGAWWARIADSGGRVRGIGLYGGLDATLRQVPGALADWLAPSLSGALATAASVGLLALLVGLVARAAVRAPVDAAHEPDPAASARRRVIAAGSAIVAWHLATVAAARVLGDPLIPFDARLLAPAILVAVVLAAAAAPAWWASRRYAPRTVLALALAGWAALAAGDTFRGVRYIRANGYLLTAPVWRRSAALAWLRGPGPELVIFSNDPGLIWFHTGRRARELPPSLDGDAERRFARLLNGNAVVVLVDAPGQRDYSVQDLVTRMRLRPVVVGPEAAVLVPGEAAAPAPDAPPPPVSPR